MQCIQCNSVLSGLQKRFCSTRCKSRFHNPTLKSYPKQKERGLLRKIYLIKLRDNKCNSCGYNKNITSLVFHHIDPTTKKFKLDARQLSNRNWEVILDEFNKCLLLCHNCHYEHHHPEHELSKLSLPDNFDPKKYNQ